MNAVVHLTDDQRSVILSALYDALIDAEHYLSGSKVDAEPRPEDSCCDFYLGRHRMMRENYLALKAKRERVKDTIKLVESVEGGDAS